ncbi:NAD(P)-binding protein [Hortaea werneckii]|nr:NAD(P)-binding protein [Hortaea werneckii]KAI7504862.1 NAD(P)-binding protein [Hortaea werneckii]
MADATDANKLFSVEGMVVLITGGGTGIGQMMTRAFATNGAAKVYIVGRRKEKLDETAAINPDVIIPLVGDVTSKESLCRVADHVEQDAGYVNLVCVNSGTMPPGIGVSSHDVDVHTYRAKALEQRTEDWEETFKTNSIAVFFTTMAFLSLLDAGNRQQNFPRQQSQVLVTSSIAGYLRVPMNLGVYPASKASATHLVKHLAGTLVPYGIRVNAIAPGLFPSDLAAGLIARANTTDGRDATAYGAFGKEFIPAERLGRLEDMAGTVLYMASAAGAYLNGNITVLDGVSSTLPSLSKMTINVLPLQPADIPAFVRLELEAFRTHPRMPMLWPRGFTSDLYAYYENNKTQSLQKETSRILKAVDDETGEIVAVAQWTFALEGNEERNRTSKFADEQPPANWPEGGNWELRRFFKIEWEAWRAKTMGGKPYIELNVLVTHPKHERRGAATQLLRWGCEQADKLGVAMCLESTPTGLKLYERFEFRTGKVIKADMRDFGWTEPYDEDAARRIWMVRDCRMQGN